MANAPSKTILVAGIGVALGAMLMLNVLAQRIDPKYQEKVERDRQAAEAQKREQEIAKQGGKVSPLDPPVGEGRLVELGEEKVLGKPDGKQEIIVGYEWTPAVQADPTKVFAAITAIQKAAPEAKIRVVNVDAKPDVSPGVTIGGKVVIVPQPDGSIPADEHGLQDALGLHDHGGNTPPAAPVGAPPMGSTGPSPSPPGSSSMVTDAPPSAPPATAPKAP
jgi:hypothetical protein